MTQKFLRSRNSDRLFLHKAVSTGLWRLQCFENCFEGKKRRNHKHMFFEGSVWRFSELSCPWWRNNTKMAEVASKNRKTDSERKL